ncbi:MAG: prolyl-tRNA synthetase associated domain-containing protein [Clostridia bacterium]|nr:prolyl-tRNA synthetase associated domain-containing protein [Clostridia bacterium]
MSKKYTLFHGAPEDVRSEREMRCYALLDSLGIDYLRVDHDPAATMEACARADALLGGTICKNLFLCNRQQTQFYLLMLPGGKTFHTRELSSQLQVSRLSFAPGEAMVKYLDIYPGSLSVLGLMNDREGKVRLLADEALNASGRISCHPCVNTSSLSLSKQDMFEVFLPAVRHDVTFVTLSDPE